MRAPYATRSDGGTARGRTALAAPFVMILIGAIVAMPSTAPAKKAPRVTSITLEPSADKVSLLPGEQQAIRAVATYSDKTTEDVTQRLVYTSSKPDVVEVAGQGIARAIKGGDAEIKAYDPQSGKNARTSVKFKVAKLKRIDVLPESKIVPLGRTLALRAMGSYDNGRSGVDITDRVTWSSDKVKVVAVEQDAGGTVLARGAGAGKTKVVAFEPLDRVKSESNSSKVTVVSRLLSIVVEPASILLRNGQTAKLTARGVFEGGAEADLTPWVEWTTSDPAVARAEAGQVTALGMGSAAIGARDPETGVTSAGGERADVDVVGGLIGLVATPANVTLPIGGTSTMAAFAAFEGADDPVQLDTGVAWKSSNTASVAIDGSTGAARCVAAGAATISFVELASAISSTAFSGDARVACVSSTATVRVAPAKKLVGIGKAVTLTAFLLLPDGTERDITTTANWTSSRPDVLAITRVGDLVRGRGVAPGVATVTAVDPVTGTSSAGADGISSKLSVPGAPRVLKIFPAPTSSAGIELTAGTPFLLKARVDFEGGANQGANNLVLWTSSDPSVLRVSNGEEGKQPGHATPLRPGDVTVTIQYPKPGAPPPQFPPAQPMSKSVKVRVR